MSIQFNWVGEEAYDRVALTRLRSYAPNSNGVERFANSVRLDARQKPGDFLLATRDGIDVGTSTSVSLKLWLRGARLDCQGVAYVGTIKTGRRGVVGGEPGVATQLMHEMLNKARERAQPVTALMPFRASFYEHFGYGNAERRVEWIVPISLFPKGDFDGYRFFESADTAAILKLRADEARQGQCDVETDAAALTHYQRGWGEGMTFVDASATTGEIVGYAHVVEERGTQLATLTVEDWGITSRSAFVRLLHLLASLRDQYSFVRITLPADLPLNRLLRESQIAHRQVDHPVATARTFTRMQLRVLDHKRILEAMTLPSTQRGKLTLAIRETEGNVSRLTLDFDAGRIVVTPANGDADVTMTDVLWASIVTGDLTATSARSLELIECRSEPALTLLDAFSVGPAPFCQEYF